jgi:flagellar M-ring protein FliF
MKSALAGTMERARSTFSTISLGQKVVIGLLLVGLLLGGFFFFRWITAPTQAPLFSNLASADATAARRSWSRRTRSTTCACP